MNNIFECFGSIFNGLCGCGHRQNCKSSCDVLWIIILLMLVFKGGCLGLDICTIAILFIVFGDKIFGKGKCGCNKCN